GRQQARREEVPWIGGILEQDNHVAAGTRVREDQIGLAIAVDITAHHLVRLPAGRNVYGRLVGTRTCSVHEHRDTAGGEIRNHEIEGSGAGEVHDRDARGVVPRRRVLHTGMKRSRGTVVAEDDIGEARVLDIALVGGGGDQQIGRAVPVHVRDRYGVRHVDGRKAVIRAVVTAGEGAEQQAQTHGREQPASARLDVHCLYPPCAGHLYAATRFGLPG